MTVIGIDCDNALQDVDMFLYTLIRDIMGLFAQTGIEVKIIEDLFIISA